MKGRYNNSDDVIRIFNEDCTGRKLFRISAQASDEKALAYAFNSIIDKYGLKLRVTRITEKDKLDFLKADENFSF